MEYSWRLFTLDGTKTFLYQRLVYPYNSVRKSLQQLLSRPGFWDKCQEWKKQVFLNYVKTYTKEICGRSYHQLACSTGCNDTWPGQVLKFFSHCFKVKSMSAVKWTGFQNTPNAMHMDLLLNSGVTHLTYLDPRVLFQVRELSQFVHLEKQLTREKLFWQ